MQIVIVVNAISTTYHYAYKLCILVLVKHNLRQ